MIEIKGSERNKCRRDFFSAIISVRFRFFLEKRIFPRIEPVPKIIPVKNRISKKFFAAGPTIEFAADRLIGRFSVFLGPTQNIFGSKTIFLMGSRGCQSSFT